MAQDFRWRQVSTLIIFFAQLLCIGTLIGLAAPVLLNRLHIGPLVLAIVSGISVIIHMICYFTASLHPLVVLTINGEFVLLWLALSVYIGVIFPESVQTNCKNFRTVISLDESISNRYKKHSPWSGNCKISTAVYAFSLLTLLSHTAIVALATATRRRNKTPLPPPPRFQVHETFNENRRVSFQPTPPPPLPPPLNNRSVGAYQSSQLQIQRASYHQRYSADLSRQQSDASSSAGRPRRHSQPVAQTQPSTTHTHTPKQKS